jgi:tungstate transport system substrate-binding protein
MLKKLFRIILVSAFSLFLVAPVHAAETLRLATTTSTEFTGLLDWLHPHFEKRHNVRIHTIAVGTGKALSLGRNGDVDVVLVHTPGAELKFVNAGYGVSRRGVMYNDFVIVGPMSDPAGVSKVSGTAAAFRRIREKKALWVSRGDDSGTHKKEKILWRSAGVKPEGKWHRSLGQGMGATLRVADEIRAYTLTDRGSFLFFDAREKVKLKVLVEGGKELLNPYGVIAVNPARHPHIKFVLAMKYIRFLTSAEGQRLIGDFRVKEKKIFHPSSAKGRAGN